MISQRFGTYLSIILGIRHTIESGYENLVNVGLRDIKTELLITLEVLEDEYLEVGLKLML